MPDLLQTLLIAGSLVLAALALGYVALDRRTGPVLLTVLALLELGLVVLAVVGIVQLAGDDPAIGAGTNGVVLVGYLLGMLLFLPVSAAWALGEPSRAGTAVLVVVGLVLPVLLLRVDQVWTAPGG